MPGAQTLYFRPDHPCNTRITDALSGDLLYIVRTKVDATTKRTTTEVRKAASAEVIAVFEWRDFRSDLLTFWSDEPIKASDWIKKSLIPFKETVTFTKEPWKTFKWKNFAPALSLELYDEGDKTTPLARFSKPAKVGSETMPASLEILPRAASSSSETAESQESLRDRIVMSFLYLEKMRRGRDEDEFGPTSRPKN
ncbi:hypothetical protein PLICRDRAFT_40010 [Plicaturopsis crispa FD-325 SS-3]|nr:hypothetical protein PLICRDRAFT_40010 [Plicaturopsis crispa FD-325 SS-3]